MATIAFILLLSALIIQIVFILKSSESPDPVSHFLLIPVLILLVTTTIIRSIKINFAAVTTTYESLLLFAESIILLLIIYRLKAGKKSLAFIIGGGTLLSLILLSLASSPIIPSILTPPVPALQSYWLVLHVAFSFFGEAFFSIAFLSSIYYLFSNDDRKKMQLDKITYKTIIIGYCLFTTGGMIFGAVWAYYAWGRYWGWDPKETSAFITWLIYTIYLHQRLTGKIKGKIGAILSITGFLLTIFTFLGVNYLMSGLHSYN